MMTVGVLSVGLSAPGLPSWAEGAAVLRGERPYQPATLAAYAPVLLPANERRRATAAVRQAFRAGEEAIAGRDASALATVFASSDGDLNILNRICGALTSPGHVVSPTDFHNSVHNAAAGYWGIATGARAPSTTLAGYDGSFALGLLEAATQVVSERHPVLLVAFDVPAPEPIALQRTHADSASCALWLQPPDARDNTATLELGLTDAPETDCADEPLERARRGNPALRALPLLLLLARAQPGRVVLPMAGGRRLAVALRG
ncbi:beta-ketoacyl synthase chain length factor [Fontimonas sp. SYSU GA230001]|uniref:beta-ketoacyl synthase chain length factor n=1 Tax=Fontimonas sp. SYSU GA230001 TaxID=3142450 RepID=UPI0032B5BAFE